MSNRGFATSWKTNITKVPCLGDEFDLPTFRGMAKFTVVKIEENIATVKCGNWIGHIKKEDGEWFFPHRIIDSNITCRGTITNEIPSSNMNPHIGTKKIYK